MKASLKKRLTRGDLLTGTIVTLPAAGIAEILCLSGFDWLFVDLEHSALSIRDAQTILQAAAPQVPCLIRVPAHDEAWIKRSLDIGAAGIIAPQVRTADEAHRVVALCRYPPKGQRSVGIARAHGYGTNFQGYVAAANDETAVILQIEHIEAVKNIDSIVKVPGIDGLFVGPYDLSASMEKTGQVNDPEVQAAISRVRECAQQAGIPLGIFGATAEAVKPYIKTGYTLIAVGMDAMLLSAAAQQITDALK